MRRYYTKHCLNNVKKNLGDPVDFHSAVSHVTEKS